MVEQIDAAIALTATATTLYALRADGAVFVLIPRGAVLNSGVVEESYWAMCPAVPGTFAAKEQAG